MTMSLYIFKLMELSKIDLIQLKYYSPLPPAHTRVKLPKCPCLTGILHSVQMHPHHKTSNLSRSTLRCLLNN